MMHQTRITNRWRRATYRQAMVHVVSVVATLNWSAGAVALDRDQMALRRLMSPPQGLPPVAVGEQNKPTVEKIRLGRKLFFDRRLSSNGTMSCGMCHIPEHGFTQKEIARPVGIEGSSLRRNAPTLYNVAYVVQLFHDGRETSLETQALGPMLAPEEMSNPSLGWIVRRVRRLDDYQELFLAAYGGGPTVDRIGEAIAAWERTILSANSPFDRWRYGGEPATITRRQEEGFELFIGKAGCVRCHPIGERFALFTDGRFHDTGIGYRAEHLTEADPTFVEIAPGVSIPVDRRTISSVGDPERPDRGRFELTRDPVDRWRFRTPGLRNVALTAPYMHDGSLKSLEEVVDYYDRGGESHDGLDPLLRPLGLGPGERRALVEFLRCLTGDNIDELTADARSVEVGNPASRQGSAVSRER